MIMSTIASIGLVGLLWRLVQARSAITGTTLTAAWAWGIAACVMWLVAQVATAFPATPDSVLDLLWYAAAVLAVCPFIAVLGARNPGAKAWTGFVMLPLILVLSWPALATMSGNQNGGIEITGPIKLGFCVAMVMGAGNYVGTRFTMPAIAVMVVFFFLLGTETPTARAILSTIMAAVWLLHEVMQPNDRAKFARDQSFAGEESVDVVTRYETLWADFRDYYGLVWAKRVMDRLNQLFARDKLPIQVGIGGVIWNEGGKPTTSSECDAIIKQADKSVFWILGRFVDNEWLGKRLPIQNRSMSPDPPEASSGA